MYATDIALSLNKNFDDVGIFRKDEFIAFFKDNVLHCLIQKDTVAWIPYGHCSTLISLQGQEYDSSGFLTVPYMCVGLLHKAPSAPRTAFGKIIEECCDTLPSGSKHQQAVSLFLAWFRSSLEEERNEEEEDEEDESSQGVAGLIMHAAGSDIVQDTEMANAQAATLEG